MQKTQQGVLNSEMTLIVESHFSELILISAEPYRMAKNAAEIYRALRKKGLTIRKPNDCLIAAYAIDSDAFLLQDDSHFNYISENSALKIVKP